jgi:hypothetical protein
LILLKLSKASFSHSKFSHIFSANISTQIFRTQFPHTFGRRRNDEIGRRKQTSYLATADPQPQLAVPTPTADAKLQHAPRTPTEDAEQNSQRLQRQHRDDLFHTISQHKFPIYLFSLLSL